MIKINMKSDDWKKLYFHFAYKANGRPYHWTVVPEPLLANQFCGWLYSKWMEAVDNE